MNARRFAFPLLSALILASGSSSRAWGPVGHKTVGMIAQSRLSPQALRAIAAILGLGVSLEKIANCPDQFVFTPDRNCAGAFTMQGDPLPTKPWHYINIPVDASADATSMMSYCPQDACVVAQIRKDVAVLKDPAAPLDDKRMALMFLVHFVGDVHQPLHSATDTPDDFGGNRKIMHAITYLGKPLNLHSIWDEEIDDPAKVDYRLPADVLTAQAETLARALEAGLQVEAAWTTGDLAGAAALESHAIAQTVIYPAYRASDGQDLLADYRAKMQPIAYRRIQMAGVRLAALLEQALGAPVPSHANAARAAAQSLSALRTTKDALGKQ